MKKTIEEAADLAIADVDESDLSPQVNIALRKQIVTFVVNGITEAINLGTLIGEPKNLSLKNVIATTVNIKQDPALIPNLAVTEFLLEGEYPFKSYAPKVFEAIRKNEGMNDLYYKDVIGQPASERLSEGASGALCFSVVAVSSSSKQFAQERHVCYITCWMTMPTTSMESANRCCAELLGATVCVSTSRISTSWSCLTVSTQRQ